MDSVEDQTAKPYEVTAKKKKVIGIAVKVLLCLLMIGCGTAGGFVVGDLIIGKFDTFDPSGYSASAYKEKDSDIAKWKTMDISKLTPTQIFVVAEAKINECENYCIYTKGYDGGEKGVVTTLGMKQDLYGYRYRKGTKGYFDYFSTGLANVAKKTEFTFGENKFYSYEGSLNGDNVTWTLNKPESGQDYRTDKEYEEMTGLKAENPIDYIVSRKTVQSEKNNGKVKELYSYTINLNPTLGVLNYVKKMNYMSGFGYPKFSSIELRFEVDKNMNFQNIYINESYKVIGMSAVGKYKNEFHYNIESIVEK